jgi:hypothetical protein
MLQVNYTHNAKVFEFDLLFGLVGKQKARKGYKFGFPDVMYRGMLHTAYLFLMFDLAVKRSVHAYNVTH